MFFFSFIRDPINPYDKFWIRVFNVNKDKKALVLIDMKWNVILIMKSKRIELLAPESIIYKGRGFLVDRFSFGKEL